MRELTKAEHKDKPFDIEQAIDNDESVHDMEKPWVTVEGDSLCVEGKINKRYAEFIAKHFKLI